MKLTSYGAAGTTTGSQHLLEINGQRLLLDCGLFEGKRQAAFEKNKHFLFDPKTIDTVVLSHAHIDHTGNLPNLVHQGFGGNIYATPATRSLCTIMLADSARIQQSDNAFVNKRRAKLGQPPMEALYGPHEAERTMKQFVTVDYHRPIPVADGVTLTYLDAGHMLGSAQVCLDLRENGVKRRLLFSGDVGRGHNDILRDPEACEDVDYLLMESTYGGVDHETSDFADSELCAVINEAMKSQGKIIIPSFAVGRTQSVVYALHKLRETNCFPAIPIFVDSPLAVNATEVFRLHPECYNQPILDFLHQNKSPFGWSEITYIRDAQQSQQLNTRQEPMIIISSSGMCEAGRVLHHLRNNLSKSETTVLFVGYCAENTLGAKLLAGEKHVRVFGEPVEVNAQMVSLSGFSGHADHSELCTYASNVKGPKRGIHLVHGEPKRSEPLRAALTTQHPESEVRVAVQGEAWELV